MLSLQDQSIVDFGHKTYLISLLSALDPVVVGFGNINRGSDSSPLLGTKINKVVSKLNIPLGCNSKACLIK